MRALNKIELPSTPGCELFIGFPFSPANKAYHIEPRSDYRPSSSVKHILKNNVLKSGDLTIKLAAIVGGLVRSSPVDFPVFTSENISIGSPDRELLGDMISRWSSHLLNDAHASESKIQNTALLLSGLHEEVAADHFFKNPSSIREHWLGRMVLSLHKNLSAEFDGLEVDTKDPLARILLTQNIQEPMTWWSALQNADLLECYGDIIVLAVAAAQQARVNHDVIKGLWLLSFVSSNPTPFIMAVSGYRLPIDEDDFPYLAFEVIDNAHEHLNTSGPTGMPTYDYVVHIGSALNTCAALAEPQGDVGDMSDGWRRLFALKSFVEQIDVHYIQACSVFNSVISEIRSTRTLVEGAPVCDAKIKSGLLALLEENERLAMSVKISSETDVSDLVQLGGLMVEQVEQADRLCLQHEKLTERLAGLLDKLKAQTSAADILDDKAFAKLSELRANTKKTKDELEIVDKSLNEAWQALSDLYTQLAEALAHTLNKSDQSKSNASEDELLKLQDKLDESEKAYKQLQAKLSQLEVAAKNKASEPTKGVAFELVEAFIGSSQGLADVVRLLSEQFKSRVHISPSAWKSMASNKEFSRNAVVFEKLRKLLSDEFMSSYLAKGALGAFEHFTKTELAFKESDTTMAAMGDTRRFTFDDGVERECSYHLRIGTSGTRQHMLRIYFTIESGAIYIGEVTHHLPVSTKR